MKRSAPQLRSEAWLLRGLSSIPGWLTLAEGRLAFTAEGPGTAWPWQLRRLERDARRPGLALRIDAGEEALVFDLPLASVQVRFPWHYFMGGMKLAGPDARHRISLARPANTGMPVNRLDADAVLAEAVEEFDEVRSMRASGKAWRAALTRAREGG